jgi:hypothetical protein
LSQLTPPVSVRLEDVTPGARIHGVLPDRPVTVVQVEWHGTQALTLTYRDDAGKVDHELLYRANEARLEIEDAAGPGASTPTAGCSGSPRTCCGFASRTSSTRT